MNEESINYDIDYENILSSLSTSCLKDIIEILSMKLPTEWCEKYRDMTPTATNILQFKDSGFEYLFDFSSEIVAQGIVPEDQAVDDRVVAVFGLSHPRHVKRDKKEDGRLSWSIFESLWYQL